MRSLFDRAIDLTSAAALLWYVSLIFATPAYAPGIPPHSAAPLLGAVIVTAPPDARPPSVRDIRSN